MIDNSLLSVPKLQFLDLSHNNINCIQNLSHLSQLRELNLSFNNFSYLEDVHTKLGNVKVLILDSNKLFSLEGLDKMYSLEKVFVHLLILNLLFKSGKCFHLQLSCMSNRICELVDVAAISSLPCLISFHLKENPVCSVLEYRTKVLELFLDRTSEITLDGKHSRLDTSEIS